MSWDLTRDQRVLLRTVVASRILDMKLPQSRGGYPPKAPEP